MAMNSYSSGVATLDSSLFNAADVTALSHVTSYAGFIGAYPTGTSSVLAKFCPYYFGAMAMDTYTFGGCCNFVPCTTQYYAATGSIGTYMTAGAAVKTRCKRDVFRTLSILSAYDSATTRTTTMFFCPGGEDIEPTLWQNVTALAVSTSTSTSTSMASSSTDSFLTVPTNTPEPTPPSVPSPSQVWIIGAVLGPIAGCALVGFLVFFFAKRRSNSNAQHGMPQAVGSWANDMIEVEPRENRASKRNEMQQGALPYGRDRAGTGSVYDFDQPIRTAS